MRTVLEVAIWVVPWLLFFGCRSSAMRALRGSIVTYMTVQLEADSYELRRIFGHLSTYLLGELVREGFLERIEGLPVARRGGLPVVTYRWLSRAQRAQRAEAEAVPRFRS